MDSERRHELETNDLRDFLDNFKDFAEKHGNKILLILIIGLGTFAGINYYKSWKSGNIEEAYAQLASATSYDSLKSVAESYDLVHDEAWRRAGDIALGQARDGMIQNPGEVAQTALKNATTAYSTLADKGQTVVYQIIGHEGLAKAAEMNGEWDVATSHYGKVIDLAGETYTRQASLAQASLDQMDMLKNPVDYSPAVVIPAIKTPAETGNTGTGEGDAEPSDQPAPEVGSGPDVTPTQ